MGKGPKWTEEATFGNYFNRLVCFGKMLRFTDNTQVLNNHVFFLAHPVPQ